MGVHDVVSVCHRPSQASCFAGRCTDAELVRPPGDLWPWEDMRFNERHRRHGIRDGTPVGRRPCRMVLLGLMTARRPPGRDTRSRPLIHPAGRSLERFSIYPSDCKISHVLEPTTPSASRLWSD